MHRAKWRAPFGCQAFLIKGMIDTNIPGEVGGAKSIMSKATAIVNVWLI